MTSPLDDIFTTEGGPLLSCANIHKRLKYYIIKRYLGGDTEKCKRKYFVNEEDIARDAELELYCEWQHERKTRRASKYRRKKKR